MLKSQYKKAYRKQTIKKRVLHMANKAQILVNRSEDQPFIAPRTFCRAIASQKAFKHSFLTRKCVINTQNQADFVYLNYAKQSQSQNSIPLKGAGREKGCRARREKSFGAPAH